MRLTRVEINRKLVHMIFGVIVIILLKRGLIGVEHIAFLIVVGIIVSFLSRKYFIPAVPWIVKNLEREENLKKFPGKGAIFYLIGIFFVVAFFPTESMDIASASIIILAFADSASYIFGVRFGRTEHPFTTKKFIEGMVAGIIAGFIAASIFVPWYEALIASTVAMIAEGIEIKVGLTDVDDNIVMPVAAAFAIWVLRLFL